MAPGNFSRRRRACLIVGGGYIGLEAQRLAAKARRHGHGIVLVEAAERIFAARSPAPKLYYFAICHRSRRCPIFAEGSGLCAADSAGAVTGAELADGNTLDIDFAVVGVGLPPATGIWRTGAGLTRGITALLATPWPPQGRNRYIWAQADCAFDPQCRAGGARIERCGQCD